MSAGGWAARELERRRTDPGLRVARLNEARHEAEVLAGYVIERVACRLPHLDVMGYAIAHAAERGWRLSKCGHGVTVCSHGRCASRCESCLA